MYSPREIEFLLDAHSIIETASLPRGGFVQRSTQVLNAVVSDPRALGMPQRMFETMLERRAAKLGAKFTEFRRSATVPVPPGESLDISSAVEASKLF